MNVVQRLFSAFLGSRELRSPVVQRFCVFPIRIPLRGRVTHAAGSREAADPVIVTLETITGSQGVGETLPRPYVTGETVESVLCACREVYAPWLVDFHPSSFPEALERIEALPWVDQKGQSIPAARAAVELALLDVSMRVFDRDADAVVRWMGLPAFGSPGILSKIRFSGVLAAESAERTLRHLRLMYWAGLRDFKLKVGFDGDLPLVKQVSGYLGRSIARGNATLRVDANGGWSSAQAIEWLSVTAHLPISAVEQPLPRGKEEDLVLLKEKSTVPIVHDESLVTWADAQRLKALGVADIFNIRISKCGGWMPALRLAAYARREGVGVQLGSMVGETTILSAAGLRFLHVCPDVRWAEGCFGRYLLKEDVATPPLRFGYGGHPPRIKGSGWGMRVDERTLRSHCTEEPIILRL